MGGNSVTYLLLMITCLNTEVHRTKNDLRFRDCELCIVLSVTWCVLFEAYERYTLLIVMNLKLSLESVL